MPVPERNVTLMGVHGQMHALSCVIIDSKANDSGEADLGTASSLGIA